MPNSYLQAYNPQEVEIELDQEHWFWGSHLFSQSETLCERRSDSLYEAKFNIYKKGTRTPLFVEFYACNDQIFLAENDFPEESELEFPLLAERIVKKLLLREDAFKSALVRKLEEHFFPNQ